MESLYAVIQSLLVAQVLFCKVVLCPVKLVQVNTVLDYKLLRDDLPSVLQGIEHMVNA